MFTHGYGVSHQVSGRIEVLALPLSAGMVEAGPSSLATLRWSCLPIFGGEGENMSVKIDGYELPSYVSYSGLSTWLQCGYQYFLTRMVNVDEVPAWYLIGGNAVHKATEDYDKELFEREGR